jgi:hypothetical protein
MGILNSVIKIKQINIAMHWLKVAQHHNLALLQRNFRMIDLKQLSERESPEEFQD